MYNTKNPLKDLVLELSDVELESLFFNKRQQLHFCSSDLVKEISDELYEISKEIEKRMLFGNFKKQDFKKVG